MDDHFIAILDEVDVIEDDTIIHALHDLPDVTLILVAVSEDDLFTDLDSRVVSRLRGSAKVTLDKYSHAELCDILWGWIDAALRAGVVDADDESRVIVDDEEQWEFDVDDDEHARPRTETTVPVWMEGLLQQIGIRGLRIGSTEGK